MKLITKKLETKIETIECGQSDVENESIVLEEAVLQQFSSLNLGILSDKLLCEGFSDVDLDLIRPILISLYPEDSELINSETYSYISNGIYTNKWKVIGVDELDLVKIRIIGKSVHLWDIFEINEQLSFALSSIRVFFAGAISLLNIQFKKMLGKTNVTNETDVRFIVGEVGPSTISYGGRVFDFVSEYVKSPYLDNTTPGFAIEDAAVIRREVLKTICEEKGNDIEESILHAYYHEIMHTVSYSGKNGFPYSSSNWEVVIRRDICRFLKKAHTKNEIEKAFTGVINDLSSLDRIFGKDKFKQFTPFWDVFNSLVDQGMIDLRKGNYYVFVNEERKRWPHFLMQV